MTPDPIPALVEFVRVFKEQPHRTLYAPNRIEDIVPAIEAVLTQLSQREWLPTSANINALPEPIRRFIHDLETRCDPAGDIRELTIARDTCRALEAELAKAHEEMKTSAVNWGRTLTGYLDRVNKAEAKLSQIRETVQQLQVTWREQAQAQWDNALGLRDPGRARSVADERRLCATELQPLLDQIDGQETRRR